jgi:hypothetical protein
VDISGRRNPSEVQGCQAEWKTDSGEQQTLGGGYDHIRFRGSGKHEFRLVRRWKTTGPPTVNLKLAHRRPENLRSQKCRKESRAFRAKRTTKPFYRF